MSFDSKIKCFHSLDSVCRRIVIIMRHTAIMRLVLIFYCDAIATFYPARLNNLCINTYAG